MEEHRIIRFPDGLLGFPEEKDYVILEHKKDSPFCWLQSAENPELAFVMTSPEWVIKDYLKNIAPADRGFFSAEDRHEIAIFALVSIPPGCVEKMTINLLVPLVIDAAARVGKQVVLAHSGYSHRHALICGRSEQGM